MEGGWKRSPLYPLYGAYGAKTVEFGGWELPVQFEGILKEHQAVRERAGLFDVSHMGELLVTGTDAEMLLQRVTTNDVAKLRPGDVQYTLMCCDDGGTVDDLLVYRLAPNAFMAVANAANTASDLAWLRRHAADYRVRIEDVSERTALLALQGPDAKAILRRLAPERSDLATLAPFRFLEHVDIGGTHTLVSRTGYTGEDGFELYAPAERAIDLWRALMEAGEPFALAPAGLGARDTLRLEARLPLYGHELSPSVSPLEAGLGAFVKLDKGPFIGRDALAAQKRCGPPRRLVGLESAERGIPRREYAVRDAIGAIVGAVTSGTYSPTLKKSIALALVDRACAAIGTELFVDVRGKPLNMRVAKTPFYRSRSKPSKE